MTEKSGYGTLYCDKCGRRIDEKEVFTAESMGERWAVEHAVTWLPPEHMRIVDNPEVPDDAHILWRQEEILGRSDARPGFVKVRKRWYFHFPKEEGKND